MTEQENNFNLTGDESRLLLVALLNCEASFKVKQLLSLYNRLIEINQVQPNSKK